MYERGSGGEVRHCPVAHNITGAAIPIDGGCTAQ
jgi:hypothetical protein